MARVSRTPAFPFPLLFPRSTRPDGLVERTGLVKTATIRRDAGMEWASGSAAHESRHKCVASTLARGRYVRYATRFRGAHSTRDSTRSPIVLEIFSKFRLR